MNYLDNYDITSGNSTPPSAQPEQSLNEEVSHVIGQLGRFWGGFRKQSQTALEAARKDLGDVVVQAQRELSKLTTTGESSAAPSAPTARDLDAGPPTDTETTPSASMSASITEASEGSSTPNASTQTLFSRLQSALPPNIVSTVNSHIPESLKHVSENIDFTQMRTTLLGEIQRVQGVTRAQAEEYAHKSEALLREAVKEASEVLREAVKVVPPEEAEPSGSAGSGLVWDGTDMWMLSSESAEGKASEPRNSGEKRRAVATRAEALLRRLKTDPLILRHDPDADVAVKDQYSAWVEAEINSKEGGIEGEEWSKQISTSLEDPADGQALKKLHETLVPAEMSNAVFWSRFFFRSHQIREEEEKRKALIQSTSLKDEDFSWEDEEEEPITVNASIAPGGSLSATDMVSNESPSTPFSEISLSAANTARHSSEDGFDVVSNASGPTTSGDGKSKSKSKDDSDGDSDWE